MCRDQKPEDVFCPYVIKGEPKQIRVILFSYWSKLKKALFLSDQDSLGNLIGENVLTWGCFNGCDVLRRFELISMTKSVLCVPKNMNLLIIIWLYSTKITIFKMTSIIACNHTH